MYKRIRKLSVFFLMFLLLGLVACDGNGSGTENGGNGNKPVKKYEITFKDEDGTVLKIEEFSYGEMAIYNGAIPKKPSTGEYTYTFDDWVQNLE